jgi:nucleoside 2-deoxyribosyltransferase
MKIYLAGPLFTTAERRFNARLKELLAGKGHDVWLPQESEQESMTPEEIFQKDVQGIDCAEAVVANMDGPDPDSGTCWECGYAYKKKPIIVFRTDFRAAYEIRHDLEIGLDRDQAPYNLMLTESADVRLDLPFRSTEVIADEIDHALRMLPRRSLREDSAH